MWFLGLTASPVHCLQPGSSVCAENGCWLSLCGVRSFPLGLRGVWPASTTRELVSYTDWEGPQGWVCWSPTGVPVKRGVDKLVASGLSWDRLGSILPPPPVKSQAYPPH
ncbi:hypothetical protein KIL84_021215 [Mauremys mutica]|uniref:Uncharacterized protein n=1 Tax=Mauremys mutica TaxID=74926 RepID=A0A9D3XB56_9SAUR|nr:hypothetical protein KIL84_021215 [Mauremys mutica]